MEGSGMNSDVDSDPGRIRIHIGPWIQIQSEKQTLNKKVFFSNEIIFFKCEPKKVANL